MKHHLPYIITHELLDRNATRGLIVSLALVAFLLAAAAAGLAFIGKPAASATPIAQTDDACLTVTCLMVLERSPNDFVGLVLRAA